MTHDTDARTTNVRVAASRELGPQFVDNPHRMVGQDGAFSIPLNDGQTLWFFGDTLIGTRPPAGQSLWYIDGAPVGHRDMSGRGTFERMLNNTGLVSRDRNGRDGLRDYRYITSGDGNLKTLLPLDRDEHRDWDRIWCQHGIAIGRKIYLSFIKVRMVDGPATGPLPVMFEIVGSGLAVGSAGDWNFRRLMRGDAGPDPSILWSADQPHFATAFLADLSQGWLYLYGTVKRGERQLAHVARVRRSQIEQLESYEYFAGNSGEPIWSSDVNRAQPIFEGMPSELSVSFNAYLGCYLAVHSLDLSGKIVARTSGSPWGTWSEPTVLWTVRLQHDAPPPYPPLIYAGKEHPELSDDGGRTIYLTYIEFEEYFPHLVEVTLAKEGT